MEEIDENKEYLKYLEKNHNLLNNYRDKAGKHKIYFERMWFFSGLVLFHNLDFITFLPFFCLGIISVSYVNSSYLNIPKYEYQV